jgi:hypothetical protein
MKDIETKLLHLLGEPDYVPLNIPELLRQLRLPPNRQQELQRVLRELGPARSPASRATATFSRARPISSPAASA